jgi:hypothetical protein
MNGNGAPPRADIVKRSEIIRSSWAHDLDQGLDWHVALEREYWSLHIEKFRPGDSVEIHSNDHQVQFRMLILDINPTVDYLQAAFLPIYPPDLALPETMPLQRPPRYAIRASAGLWNVHDLETGKIVHESPKDRSGALELCSEMNRALSHSEAALNAAVARQLDQAEDAPAKSKAAARMKRMRERRKQPATEGAAA